MGPPSGGPSSIFNDYIWRNGRASKGLITIPCVGVSDAMGPIWAHINSALGSGDISYEEMQEVVLQFSAYSGVAKAQVLQDVVAQVHAGAS